MGYIKKTQLKGWFYSWIILLLAIPWSVISVPTAQAVVVADPPPTGECTQSIATVIVMDVSNSMGECTGVDWSPIDFSGVGKSGCQAVGGTWQDTLLDEARDLALYYVNDLVDSVSPPGDLIGLVSFAENLTVTSNYKIEVPLGSDTAAVVSALNSLSSGQGGTDLGAGIQAAVDMLSDSNADDKKILVFSDGDPTLPIPPAYQTDSGDEQAVLTAYSDAQAAGIKIYSFDMNSDSNDSDVMEQIAVAGGYFNGDGTTADLDNIYSSNKYISCPEPGVVMACKIDYDSGELLDGWQIRLSKIEDGQEVSFTDQFTGDSAYENPPGCVVFNEVEPGEYKLTETMKEGWDLVSPEIGKYQFVVEPGDNYLDNPFIFVNRRSKGMLTICKQEDLDGNGQWQEEEPPVPGWTFYLDGEPYTDGVEGDKADGCVTISDLYYGSYIVTEELREGWRQTGADGDGVFEEDGSVLVDINDNNSHPVIYFLNQREEENPPYCGDGQVNQEWEQCDGEQGCLDTCQWEEQDQCSDLVLARVVVENVDYGNDAYLTDKVYVGSSDYYVPSGTWFPLYSNGSYFTDPDIASYEDVDGLAVQRLEDSVRLVLYGSRKKTGDSTANIQEHADGYIEFYNANITHLRDDKSGNNRLEKDQEVGGYNDGDGSKGGPGDDEVWLENGRSNFWLSVDVADDGYYTDWQIAEDCRDIITVCKYDTEENPLPGWEMNLESTDNLVVNGDFETPVVTDHNNRWELFTADQVGWNIEWVNSGIEDDPVLELQTSNLWAPASGNQYAELDTHYYNPSENPPRASVSIWQDIPTVPGRKYRLTFAFSPRPSRPESDNQLRVQFGDLDQTVTSDGSGNGDTAWVYYNYVITATDNTTTLRFTDMGTANSLGTFLDYVKVNEIVSGETGENGCVEFRDLEYGDYTVSETMQEGWTQVEPEEGVYHLTFDEENNTPHLTFVNQREEPTGIIKVCKYYDQDNDGQYDEPYTYDDSYLGKASWWDKLWQKVKVQAAYAIALVFHDSPLSGWLINVEGEEVSYEGETGEDGCVEFEVPYGEYVVSENLPEGEGVHWVQTYPGGEGTHTVTINQDNEWQEVYFLNVQADIWGCKYDADSEDRLGGWQIELYRQAEPEDGNDTPLWDLYQTTTTNDDPDSPEYGCYYFTGIDKYDTYKLEEVAQDNWEQVSPDGYYELSGGEWSNPYDFVNRYNEPDGGQGGDTPPGGGGRCVSGCGDTTSSPPTTSSTPTPTVLGFEATFPEFSKTVDKTAVNPGETLTYSVKVKNSGQLDMTGVEITDTLPAGFVFADDNSSSRTWTIGTLAGGSEAVFVYQVKVSDSAAAGIYANTAKLISNEFDPMIVEVPVEVMPVKVAGYEALPETGGGTNSIGWLGLIVSLLGLLLVKRFGFEV